jgi:hydroxyacylglutathione hydrolase
MELKSMIQVRGVSAFDDNYIWLIGVPGRREIAIVDPGDEEPVLAILEKEHLIPVALLITHHHHDHTGGVEALVTRFGMPVYGPSRERIPALTHPLRDGDSIQLPALGLTFMVMETPGHTRGHLCYHGHGALFCGDTLFTAGCGRLFEGTAQQMHASLSRIAALPDDTLIYCAHEYTLDNLRFAQVAEPANQATHDRWLATQQARAAGLPTVPAPLALEKATNPFLRCAVPTLIEAAAKFAGHPLADGAEVFAAVRRWKDSLD